MTATRHHRRAHGYGPSEPGRAAPSTACGPWESDTRSGLVDELDQALATGALELRYQPKVDLVTERVSGFEGLLRWRHPRLGMLRPAAFIGLVERSPLLGPVTAAVLDQALAACARWRGLGLGLDVSVNVAAPSLHDARLVDEVADALARHGVPGRALVVEVTETMPLLDLTRGHEVLARLVELGVRVSLDDFGTGHSGLQRLHRLPVHEIKLDRSLVGSFRADPVSTTIVRGTIALAHDLGIEVVAEGVDDAALVTALAEVGCDAAQGWGLAPPVAEPDALATLHRVETELATPDGTVRAGASAAHRPLLGRRPSDGGRRAFPLV